MSPCTAAMDDRSTWRKEKEWLMRQQTKRDECWALWHHSCLLRAVTNLAADRHRQLVRTLDRLNRPPLNEGRSLNPGDTGRAARGMGIVLQPAQRRPESEPRRHRTDRPGSSRRRGALNEGRSLNPGDTRHLPTPTATPHALNEGRSLNPGDTVQQVEDDDAAQAAQRRPESEPRRHLRPRQAERSAQVRSTKAGV